ncbi:hypothetical protein [Cytobacillus horneckiae]|uniref:hypothetical protein n=1 Tax=Cytobacillus horneckiae TaxID=549687 RepID=UPI0019CFF2CA|nr:hypothetical protein [Cytobacillus horneckiae]MBN6889917.1 hypothetical protein [Cytobacillus horneckiae]
MNYTIGSTLIHKGNRFTVQDITRLGQLTFLIFEESPGQGVREDLIKWDEITVE